MAPPPVESILHLGFRFNPSPKDVITYYLPRLLAGEPMHPAIRAFIHDANIYACAPGVLAAQFRATPRKDDRFFFTTVQRQKKSKTGKGYVRGAGQGSWSFQKSEEIKDDGGVKVGEVTKLRYKFKNGKFADWLMEEYSCACSCPDAVVGDKERVFCRVYVSPNAGAESAARQESAAFAEQPVPPPDEPVAIAHALPARNKRPAPPPIIVKPPCPKRVRGAPISPMRPPPSFPLPRPSAPPSGVAPPSALPRQPPTSALPSQQQARACHVPEAAATRHLPPRARAHPVEQAPLTPRPAPAAHVLDPFALPDHPLSTETEDPVEEGDGFDELMKELDKIPTEEDASVASQAAVVKQEADDETLAPPLATVVAPALIPTRTQAPSVQATTVPQAPCSPVVARDPFCTESPAAAQDDDDFDLVSLVEGALLKTEQAEEDEAQDDADWFAFPLANEQVCEERDPFAAAFAAEAKRMMRS
ncbi:hypothetical protein EJB05_29668, partial [Eragrostis curvula]